MYLSLLVIIIVTISVIFVLLNFPVLVAIGIFLALISILLSLFTKDIVPRVVVIIIGIVSLMIGISWFVIEGLLK